MLDGLDKPAHDRLHTRPLYLEERGPARIVRNDLYGLHAHRYPSAQKQELRRRR